MPGATGAVNSCCVLLGGAYGAVEDEAMLMVDATGLELSLYEPTPFEGYAYPPASTVKEGNSADVGMLPWPDPGTALAP